jgi:thiamine biosynthesis protein ThiS
MRIEINGKTHSVPDACTVRDLIASLAVGGRYAIEVNRDLVPRSTHDRHRLREGDRVEIVQAIGGG